ncbi:hypothetical protein [Streptomyces sp. NPDC048361]|uniref:hypothetical protein n=1 Tax=Streptomyces sp. NPDC048361 TaxID=3154720 RepID=UPI00342D2A6E
MALTSSSSDGEFQAGTTVLKAHGLTSGEFLEWMDAAFASDDSRPLLAAHPEHYVMGTEALGARVVENIGPHVCSGRGPVRLVARLVGGRR